MLNTVAFGGDMFTSTSARAHMEQAHPAWRNRRRFINAVFWWQDDHCKQAWQDDLSRAMAKVNANTLTSVKSNRSAAYTAEADPLFFKWQAGEGTEEAWQAKRAEIRERYPYPE
jgi:hypothetical protein